MANAGNIYLHRKPKVYVTRRVPQRGIIVLLEGCNVSMWESEEQVPRGELLQGVVGAAGIMCMPSDRIDKEVLDAAGPVLRAIATVSTDSSNIDVKECNRRHIRVIVCSNQSVEGLADLTVALVLQAHKTSNTDAEQNVTLSNNPLQKVCLKHLENKTFGIYGLTILGHSVARRLKELGAKSVIAADYSYTKFTNCADIEVVPWTELVRRSDIICNCSQNDTNPTKVFSRDVFREMKNSAIIVDCQNGNAVSYVDLYEALRGGDIAAAGINDCNQEPVPFKYPLTGLRNCVFLAQSQESVYDIRHKVSMSVARSLKDAVNTPIIVE